MDLATRCGNGCDKRIGERPHTARGQASALPLQTHRLTKNGAEGCARRIWPLAPTQRCVESERAFQKRRLEFGIQPVADGFGQSTKQVLHRATPLQHCPPDRPAEETP